MSKRTYSTLAGATEDILNKIREDGGKTRAGHSCHNHLRYTSPKSIQSMWTTLAVLLYGLQAAQAVSVYLHPPRNSRSRLAPEDASAALSRHLGLEVFEALRDSSTLDYSAESFVAQGSNNVLLLTIDDADAQGSSITEH